MRPTSRSWTCAPPWSAPSPEPAPLVMAALKARPEGFSAQGFPGCHIALRVVPGRGQRCLALGLSFDLAPGGRCFVASLPCLHAPQTNFWLGAGPDPDLGRGADASLRVLTCARQDSGVIMTGLALKRPRSHPGGWRCGRCGPGRSRHGSGRRRQSGVAAGRCGPENGQWPRAGAGHRASRRLAG